MTDATGVPEAHLSFVQTVVEWIDGHEPILAGLVALRELGDQSEDAVQAILDVRELRKMRLGWELWEALVEGDGYDTEPLLLELMPLDQIEQCRAALWGECLVLDRPHLRLISG